MIYSKTKEMSEKIKTQQETINLLYSRLRDEREKSRNAIIPKYTVGQSIWCVVDNVSHNGTFGCLFLDKIKEIKINKDGIFYILETYCTDKLFNTEKEAKQYLAKQKLRIQ